MDIHVKLPIPLYVKSLTKDFPPRPRTKDRDKVDCGILRTPLLGDRNLSSNTPENVLLSIQSGDLR